MADLPVMLKLDGRRCVIVGGGPVAVRRAASLVEAGAAVTVIAPEVDPAVADLDVTVEARAYRTGDLAGAMLVVVATDDPEVNRTVAADAAAIGALVNRADDPEAGDVAIPAYSRQGPLTVAVHTGGISARAAATIRDELTASLDPDWPRLLEIVAPYRAKIQQAVADPIERRRRLARLTDAEAMAALKEGGPERVRRLCDELSEGNSKSETRNSK